MGALLAVAIVACLAAALVGGGNAPAGRVLGHGAQAPASPAVVRARGGSPNEATGLPQVPAGAEDAQPMATF